MLAAHCHAIKAQACFCVGDNVWAAGKDGTITVYQARSGEPVGHVTYTDYEDESKYTDGVVGRIIKGFTMVHRHLWGITASGELLVFDIKHRRQVGRVKGPLGITANRNAALTDICFDGWNVVVASETGMLFVVHPIQMKIVAQMRLLGPCTAVTAVDRLHIAGDRHGRLYVFDADTLQCVSVKESLHHSVTCLLHDLSTGWIFAGCSNGCLYAYAIDMGKLALRLTVSNVGEPLSLTEVSGTILVCTSTHLVVVEAETGKIVSQVESTIPGLSIKGAVKIRCREEAFFWTFSCEKDVEEWRVEGRFVSPCNPPALPASLPPNAPSLIRLNQEHLVPEGQMVQHERMKKVAAREAMRELLDENQELRLKFVRLQDALKSKDMEIEKRRKNEEMTKEENSRLKLDLIGLTGKLNTSQSECTSLRSELSSLKDELSAARTASNNALAEKATLQAEMSTIKTERYHVEQRLMDAQNTVSALRAENERLYRSIASMGGAKEKEVQSEKQSAQTDTDLSAEVLQYKKLNRLLTSLLATMEYTIRRKEDEERDLTCLLNAFRHRVVDRISDPHLNALLSATVMRNPTRFSYSCDPVTLAQLRDRSAPLQEFLQSLRQSDSNAYNKLVGYLQQSGSSTITQEGKKVLDNFIALAVSETQFTEDAITSFRRSIPVLFLSDSAETPSAPPGADAAPGTVSSSVTSTTMDIARKAKTEEDLTVNILRHFHSQVPLEAETMKKEQETFEFILTTRRGLVDQLVHLFHRLTMAQMACETLTAPSHLSPGGGVVSPEPPSFPTVSPEAAANHGQLITGITKELLSLSERILHTFLTTAERQRHGVALTTPSSV